jgi:hypothetical protein
MATAPVPSLSDRNWLTGPSEKVDLLLSYFFQVNVSQTYLYRGSINSAQALIEKYGNDMGQLTSNFQAALETYLKNFFDNATVKCTTSDQDPNNVSNSVTLTIEAQVVQNGVAMSVNAAFQNVNSKFIRLANYMNTGQFTQ